jgi:dephospho-CoA kinase
MLVIGLTGPTGAGKGTVAKLFASFGVQIIDADAVYHALLVPPSPCLDELTARFGSSILNPDKTLNRQALGAIVFADQGALADLNAITHRYVMEQIRAELARLRRAQVKVALLDAPQLFEAGADRDCDVVVSVLADEERRLSRITQRDGISPEAARKRMAAQLPDEFFRRNASYIIENNQTPEQLTDAVQAILSEIGGLP